MTTKQSLLLGLAALMIPLAALPAAAVGSRGKQDLEFVNFEEPAFPMRLQSSGLIEGYVEVVLLVTPDGTVAEIFGVAASHPAFFEEIEAIVPKWTFKPAAGGPAAAVRRFFIRLDFRREGVVTSMSTLEEAVALVGAGRFQRDEIRPCKLGQLDRIPETVSLVIPVYPEALRTEAKAGSVLVTFYIDERGTVRVPSVVESSHPGFAAATLAAVRQWKFGPPTRRGEPVRVYALQEFVFRPDAPTAQSRSR